MYMFIRNLFWSKTFGFRQVSPKFSCLPARFDLHQHGSLISDDNASRARLRGNVCEGPDNAESSRKRKDLFQHSRRRQCCNHSSFSFDDRLGTGVVCEDPATWPMDDYQLGLREECERSCDAGTLRRSRQRTVCQEVQSPAQPGWQQLGGRNWNL